MYDRQVCYRTKRGLSYKAIFYLTFESSLAYLLLTVVLLEQNIIYLFARSLLLAKSGEIRISTLD